MPVGATTTTPAPSKCAKGWPTWPTAGPGCVASVSGDGRLFWAEKFASSAADDEFCVDADNRLWVTFIEGKIFCLGDPVVR